MSRLSILAVLCLLFLVCVCAIKVDVNVDVGNHAGHHVQPSHIDDAAEVDAAESEEAEDFNVPAQHGKSPEKSHVPITEMETSLPIVGSSNGPNAQCTMNSAGTKLVKGFESFFPRWYNDGVGVMTIGYGCTWECKGFKAPMTEPEASRRLQESLSNHYGKCIRTKVTRHLTSNQYSALVSFVYNLGCGVIKGPLLSAINAGQWNTVTTRMQRYNRGGGKVMRGLVRRRTAEARLFKTASALC